MRCAVIIVFPQRGGKLTKSREILPLVNACRCSQRALMAHRTAASRGQPDRIRGGAWPYVDSSEYQPNWHRSLGVVHGLGESVEEASLSRSCGDINNGEFCFEQIHEQRPLS